MILFTWNIQDRQTDREIKISVVARSWVRGLGTDYWKAWDSSGEWWHDLVLDSSHGCTICERAKNYEW